MGWGFGETRGSKLIAHSGRLNGWSSQFTRFKDYNLTVVILTNNGAKPLGTLAADLAGTVVDRLALDVISDDYPDLTHSHRQFLESIIGSAVQDSWLSGALQKDYHSKDQWSGIRDMLKKDGPITLFEPAVRWHDSGGYRTRYRLEQGNHVRGVSLGWNDNGVLNYFYVES